HCRQPSETCQGQDADHRHARRNSCSPVGSHPSSGLRREHWSALADECCRMNVFQAWQPILRLLFRTKGTAVLAGIASATVTVLACIALLGLSVWFITATAIADLSIATAVVFDVFAPAAGIRLLAILRTGSRYLERLVTHDATLAILAALREKLF